MGAQVLIDSNTVIYLLKGELTESANIFLLGSRHFISAITKIELLTWGNPSLAERSSLNTFIAQKVNVIEILTPSICVRAAALCKDYALKIPDAIIAATALAEGLPLLTYDADFKRVEGLQLSNPFEL